MVLLKASPSPRIDREAEPRLPPPCWSAWRGRIGTLGRAKEARAGPDEALALLAAGRHQRGAGNDPGVARPGELMLESPATGRGVTVAREAIDIARRARLVDAEIRALERARRVAGRRPPIPRPASLRAAGVDRPSPPPSRCR